MYQERPGLETIHNTIHITENHSRVKVKGWGGGVCKIIKIGVVEGRV